MIKILSYKKYLDKDRPLRHYAQHALLALFGFFISHFLFGLNLNLINLVIFLLFTFLPDLDGVISLITTHKNMEESKEIINCLVNKDFEKAATLATINHKKFNLLMIHNVIGFLMIFIIFTYFTMNSMQIGMAITIAVIIHFTFDILDDFYQLGHINNWLWPLKTINKLT